MSSSTSGRGPSSVNRRVLPFCILFLLLSFSTFASGDVSPLSISVVCHSSLHSSVGSCERRTKREKK